jgi:3-oxoacyl-[acyl-carrier-protein] synthase-3
MLILTPKLKLRIRGVGTAVPKTEPLSNFDILKMHPETQDKKDAFLQEFAVRIERGFGPFTRHVSHLPTESMNKLQKRAPVTSESLAYEAASQAVQQGGTPSSIVLGSTTSARYTGSQAAAVSGKFKFETPTLEIKSGCSTSIAALQTAFAQLQYGYPDVLVLTAEVLSRVINPKIKETWFGFGDGAAALWLEKNESNPQFEIEKTFFSSKGELVDLYTVPGQLPPNLNDWNEDQYFMSGDAQEMKDHALEQYSRMIDALLPTEEDKKSVRVFIPHQVNLGLIEEVKKRVNFNPELTVWDARQFGNLGGTSIVFSLAKSIQENRFKKGDRILLASVGGGLSFGAQLWKVL